MRLSAEQRAAVTSTAPRLAILAGAGAGKTAVLAERVRQMLRTGTPPELVLVCTFTTAAADELRTRIEGTPEVHRLKIGTLHGWAYDVLQRFAAAVGLTPDFDVYDGDDAKAVKRDVAIDLGRPGDLHSSAADALYRQRLQDANAVDYDGMLDHLIDMLDDEELVGRAPPNTPDRERTRAGIRAEVRHILVDEAQDLDKRQHLLVELLHTDTTALIADPRQSIYRWRGARPELFHAFAAEATTCALATNYRSLPGIVDTANTMFATEYPPMAAARETAPNPVIWRPFRRELFAHTLRQTVRELETDGVPLGHIVILGRTWAVLREARQALLEGDIRAAYLGPDLSPWDSRPGRLISRWLRLQANRVDGNMTALVLAELMDGDAVRALRREARTARRTLFDLAVSKDLLPKPPEAGSSSRICADVLISRLPEERRTSRRTAWLLDQLLNPRRRTLRAFRRWWTLARTEEDNLENVETGSVTITSVHGAKGLAWPAVIIPDLGDFKGQMSAATEDRSTLYVALTRARDRLVLMYDTDRGTGGYLRRNE